MTVLIEVLLDDWLPVPLNERLAAERSRSRLDAVLEKMRRSSTAVRGIIAKQLPAHWRPTRHLIHVEICYALPPSARDRDVDHGTKHVLDTFKGVLWQDDHQVRSLCLRKSRADRASTRIRVELEP